MVDPDNDAVEASNTIPDIFNGLTLGDFTGSVVGARAIEKSSKALDYSIMTIGNQMITQYRPGQNDIELVPSFVPLAVTGVEVKGDSVVFSERGIGGAPDLIRMLASDSRRCVETRMNGGGTSFEIEYPLYRKVVIGLDDTDTSTKGATFVTAIQIAGLVERIVKDSRFLRLTLSLNWPKNPVKTTNNASSALVFAVKPGSEDELIGKFAMLAKRYSVSKETGMAVMNKVRAPEPLKTYARKVKAVHVDLSKAYKAAEQSRVRTIPITGERGLIGALSAIALVDQPGEAISPVEKTSA